MLSFTELRENLQLGRFHVKEVRLQSWVLSNFVLRIWYKRTDVSDRAALATDGRHGMLVAIAEVVVRSPSPFLSSP